MRALKFLIADDDLDSARSLGELFECKSLGATGNVNF